MKKLFIILFVFAASLSVFAADNKGLVGQLSSIKTLTAEFKQINNLKDFGDDEYTGKVSIKMGEVALWDYKEPYNSWYLIKKDTVEYFDEINNQLVKMNAKEMKEYALLQVLMDFKKLSSTFNITSKRNMLVLKPKKYTGVVYINIIFKNKIISQLESMDTAGNTTTITFSDVAYDKSISDGMFKKKLPKDVTVIEQ